MKKKLLFVMPSLSSGGGEKSLINLLSRLDYELYSVDLLLLNKEGLFLGLVPEQVQLLSVSGTFDLFSLRLGMSVQQYLLRGELALAYYRIMFSLQNRSAKNVSIGEQLSWKYMSKSIQKLNTRYDAAIGFLEKTSIYYCVEKVDAVKKIGWVHTDYDKLGMDPSYDADYFERLDYIVTVSNECANTLERYFPEQTEKINVIHNIVSPAIIQSMANEKYDDVYNRVEDEIVILSIGRLTPEKGFELAVLACKELLNRGYKLQWNIIGEGEEKEKLMKLIQENRLEQHFKLLGPKHNPYIYLKQADIYVHTSKFEGKSIAIDEAKILHKPIVVTRFNTAKDQIQDGLDGLIVDMNPMSVAAGVERLIQDRELADSITKYLSEQKLGTEEEIKKLYRLLA
ncbi:glycosyltransferase [Paenibacillus harenae]|uniref:glycosyltransferase n=1 Tax=Paenibacillus harenae TaxID=306543 RepID=UPI0004044848|nr:glycosyltransferase [Paenibacillus harenae]